MALTSFYFLCFYILVLLLYYLTPKKIQWIALLGASIVFYLFAGNWKMFLFVLYGAVVTYFGACFIERVKKERQRKVILIITILLALLTLFALKYINFFVYTARGMAKLFGTTLSIGTFQWIAPLGISFYTLSLIGYVVDVYWEISKPQKNFFRHLLFTCYFPQMTSGPIVRYQEMKPELFGRHGFDFRNISFGMQRIAWGFFKKLVISERMAAIVNTIYENYASYSGFYVIVASVCFTFQLYTDFSGCMDIILGVSESLGIRMPENFKTPFFARNIPEFWRRWHITLGIWFKEYVFYPLLRTALFQKAGNFFKKAFGRKKGRKVPTYIGLIILWFLLGLWHGGSWNFIIGTGLLHGFYMVSGEIFEPFLKKITALFKINTKCFSWHLFQSIRTFALVCVGFLFFRADSMSAAIRMIKHMVLSLFHGAVVSPLQLGLDKYDIFIGIIALFAFFVIELLQNRQKDNQFYIREKLEEQNLVFRWAVLYILLFSVVLFGFYGPGYSAAEFIYRGF